MAGITLNNHHHRSQSTVGTRRVNSPGILCVIYSWQCAIKCFDSLLERVGLFRGTVSPGNPGKFWTGAAEAKTFPIELFGGKFSDLSGESS